MKSNHFETVRITIILLYFLFINVLISQDVKVGSSLQEFLNTSDCKGDSCTSKAYYVYAKSWLGKSNDSLIKYGHVSTNYASSKRIMDIKFSSILLQAIGYSKEREFIKSNVLYDSLKNMTPIVSSRLINFLNGSLGSYYYRSEQYDSAKVYFYKSIDSFDPNDEDYFKAKGGLLMNIGLINARNRKYANALQNFENSLLLVDSLTSDDAIKLKSELNHNIGLVYKRIGDYGLAEDYYKESLTGIDKYEELKCTIIYGLITLHIEYENWTAFDSCITILKKELKDPFSSKYCHYIYPSLFDKFIKNDQLDSCKWAINKMEDCQNRFPVKDLKLNLVLDKADLAYQLADFEKAYFNYQRAFILNQELEEFRPETNATILYSLLLTKNEIENRDNTILEQYTGWKDSILSYTINEETQKWNIKYETEKREKEILILQKDQEISIAQIQRKNSLLLGGGMGITGCGFGLFYLIAARRKEKELYDRDIEALERENKEWYEKVQRYRATKQKIAIRDEDVIKINGDGPVIPLVDLKYVQSQGNYVNIHVKGQENPILLRYPLTKFLNEYLPQNIFAKVNNRTIVNMNYIVRKKALAIYIEENGSEKQFNVGRTFKENFQKLYDDLPND